MYNKESTKSSAIYIHYNFGYIKCYKTLQREIFYKGKFLLFLAYGFSTKTKT